MRYSVIYFEGLIQNFGTAFSIQLNYLVTKLAHCCSTATKGRCYKKKNGLMEYCGEFQ